jgi:oligoendopeptidase F
MEIVYPSLQSTEFSSAFDDIERGIGSLESYFDLHTIDKVSQAGPDLFDELLSQYNLVSEKIRTVNAYIHAFTSTDSRDEMASAKQSEIDVLLVRFRKLGKRFTAWIGGLDLTALFAKSEIAREHEYALEKANIAASHQMGSKEEVLASELEISGRIAWSKLHGNLSSQLLVPIEIDGEPQSLPMSVIRTKAYDADRNHRKLAFEAELAAWKTVEVPISAAMNSIKGEVITLARHRGWKDPLDEALFSSNIDGKTLEAMMTAARESFPNFRRYLNAKAKVLGIPPLAFYDIFANDGKIGFAGILTKVDQFVYSVFAKG